MFSYFVRRILLFIPVLFAISLLGFLLAVSVPGDPALQQVNEGEQGFGIRNPAIELQELAQLHHRMGLDLPLFYFSITPSSFPDTLYKVTREAERHALRSFLYQYGDWSSIQDYYLALKRLSFALPTLPRDTFSSAAIMALQINTGYLLRTASGSSVQSLMRREDSLAKAVSVPIAQAVQELQQKYLLIKQNATPVKNYIPRIHFHWHNQYARWLLGDGVYTKGALRGDLGISYRYHSPVIKVILDHVGWSALIIFIAFVLACAVSLAVGIFSARHKASAADRISGTVLFIFYAMPPFWLGIMLLLLFANPEVLHWFQPSGVKPPGGYPEGAGILEIIRISAPYLVLPILTFALGIMAYLSRMVRSSMLEVMQQDYVRTARAKGLSENRVVYKHAMRNALLPFITLFADLFPLMVGGAVVVETVFSIPGIGYEVLKAVISEDYPVVVGVLMVSGVATMAAYLFADLLYAWADPRISFSKNNTG